MNDVTSMQPVTSIAEKQSAKRRRRDLQVWPVLLALFAAPLLGAVVMTTIIDFFSGIFAEPEDKMRWSDLTLMLFSPSLWSLVCGLAYLQTVTRARGQIARHECLLLGCAGGFLMPIALSTGRDLLFRAVWPALNWNDIGFFSILGAITLPFGLFGGWVFWRLGVRPATAPTQDLAAVFD